MKDVRDLAILLCLFVAAFAGPGFLVAITQ
jgi:hypothetical protein